METRSTATREFRSVKIFVVLLLVTQVVTVVIAWTLNPIGQRSQTWFALLVAANLVSFSLVSYVNRTWKSDKGASGGILIAGSAAVLFLMVAILLA